MRIKKRKRQLLKSEKKFIRSLPLTLALSSMPVFSTAYALPYQSGYDNTPAADITTNGSTMGIAGKGDNNVLNWLSFSIGKGETVNFDDKNYLNLVHGVKVSEILGALNAEGKIYLVNPNGVIFGVDASVNVGDLAVSTRPINEVGIDDFKAGNSPLATSTNNMVGNITNLGKLQANSAVYEGNKVILRNTSDITTDGTTLLKDVSIYAKGTNDNIKIGFLEIPRGDRSKSANSLGYNEYIDGKALTSDQKFWRDYILITNMEQTGGNNSGWNFNWMRDYLRGHFMLGNDIDAGITRSLNNGAGFNPINNFTGEFEGLGFTISNMYINRPNSTTPVGVFGTISGAKISNVTFNKSEIIGLAIVNGFTTGTATVGGVVGTMGNNSVLENVNFTNGTVSGMFMVGGIVGNSNGGSDFNLGTNNSKLIGLTVENSKITGAGTGNLDGTSPRNIGVTNYIRDYVNTGRVGGIVGNAGGNTTISNSISRDNTITGPFIVGGIAGRNVLT